jgi:hypothetical protein
VPRLGELPHRAYRIWLMGYEIVVVTWSLWTGMLPVMVVLLWSWDQLGCQHRGLLSQATTKAGILHVRPWALSNVPRSPTGIHPSPVNLFAVSTLVDLHFCGCPARGRAVLEGWRSVMVVGLAWD